MAMALLAATLVAVGLYAVLLLAMPAALPHRALIGDAAFAPFHPLAGLLLWRAAAAGTEPSRRTGFRLLAMSQGIGAINTVVWVLSSWGYIALNAPAFQYVGMAMTVASVAGVAYLVPKRGVAGSVAVVPLVDASLLAIASLAVGWQFVGAPMLQMGGESAEGFVWFATMTAADTFTSLLILGAWAFPSPRIRPVPALLLAVAYGMSAWLDVVLQLGAANGGYQSGQPLDIAFAVTMGLVALAAYIERTPAVEAATGASRRAALMRLFLPFIAATAVMVPVFLQAAAPVVGPARLVPWALLLVFLALVQWRYHLLERAAERALTERMSLERDLRLSQQFESLGRYAASVAHDMNNLLAALLAQLHLVRYLGDDDAPAAGQLADMEKTLGTGTTLVRRLQQMSRGADTPAAAIDLTRAARNFAITASRLLPANVHLTLDLAAEPILAMLRPGDIDQVLLNLVVNARDALPVGGRITVRIHAADGTAELEVIDNGAGIAPEIASRIFDPFFTTKLGHGGTGLGLATVQSIVTQSGGSVDVSSAPERGTRFSVRWPAASYGCR